MISICRGVFSYNLPSSHRPVPSHSLIVRSTIRNRLAGHPCRFALSHRSSDTGDGGGLGGIIPQAAFPIFPRLAPLRSSPPPIRYGRRGDDVPGVSICGRYRWRMAAAHVGGGLLFRYDPVPIRLRRSVLLVVCPIRGTGRGLVCRPSSRYLSVSRSCRWCSGR